MSEDDKKTIGYLMNQHDIRKTKACIGMISLADQIKFTGFVLAKIDIVATYPVGYKTDCFTEMPLQNSYCNTEAPLEKPVKPGEQKRFSDERRF